MNIRFENQKRSKILSAARGFTLVETLVAIAIFAFAITGLISITAKGVFNTNFVKNKFTAGYLALEGAELVRNIRDSAAINATPWTTVMTDNAFLGDCTAPGGACYIDAHAGDLQPVACDTIDTCPFMTYNDDEAKFTHGAFDGIDNFASIFRRTIFVREISSGIEARVTSIVEWQQGTENHSVEFTYDMLNWAGQ